MYLAWRECSCLQSNLPVLSILRAAVSFLLFDFELYIQFSITWNCRSAALVILCSKLGQPLKYIFFATCPGIKAKLFIKSKKNFFLEWPPKNYLVGGKMVGRSINNNSNIFKIGLSCSVKNTCLRLLEYATRVLTRILKTGVKMLSSRKSGSFIILFYEDFKKFETE